MTIQEFYTYSWFANLAYVDWGPAAVGLDKNANLAATQAILDANNVDRIPGNVDFTNLDSLGEKIFLPVTDGGEGWRVASFEENDPDTGFSASLFVNEATGEKVLGLRGTEPEGDQLLRDLIQADLTEIGFVGMAVTQAVSLFNYVQRLQAAKGADVVQLTLKTGIAPDGVNTVDIAPGIDFWFETATAQGAGLELLSETDQVTITGHSLGGHLVAIGQRLFPGFSSPPAATFAELSPRLYTVESEDSAPGDDAGIVASIITGKPAK